MVDWKGTASGKRKVRGTREEDAISRNGPRWALLLAGSNSRRGVNCPQTREEKWRRRREREREREREKERESSRLTQLTDR